MNKFYIIAPLTLLLIFGFLNSQFRTDFHIKEEAKKTAGQKILAEKAVAKKEAELKAKNDAVARDIERKAEEKKKEDDRKANHEANVKKIQDQIDQFKASSAVLSAELAANEKTLSNLRSTFERNTREVFDLSKKCEAAKILVRLAELEIQRYTTMVATKATESSMTKAPVVTSTP